MRSKCMILIKHSATEKLDKNHPLLKSFPDDWNTPATNVYQTIQMMRRTSAFEGEEPRDGREHTVCWTHDYGKGRVFATTLGHDMKTAHRRITFASWSTDSSAANKPATDGKPAQVFPQAKMKPLTGGEGNPAIAQSSCRDQALWRKRAPSHSRASSKQYVLDHLAGSSPSKADVRPQSLNRLIQFSPGYSNRPENFLTADGSYQFSWRMLDKIMHLGTQCAAVSPIRELLSERRKHGRRNES